MSEGPDLLFERIARRKCQHGIAFAMHCSKCLGWLRRRGLVGDLFFDRTINGVKYREAADSLIRMQAELQIDDELGDVLEETGATGLAKLARQGEYEAVRAALTEPAHRETLRALIGVWQTHEIPALDELFGGGPDSFKRSAS